MPGEYASNTSVPVSKSRDEIERTLSRFGASSFGYHSTSDGEVMIVFTIRTLRIGMKMQLPSRIDFELTPTGREKTASAVEKDWEQACRQRWRTLANGVKAKLALIDDGISTVEREFLADILLPDGRNVGEAVIPEVAEAYRLGSGSRMMLPSVIGEVIE